MHTAILLTIDAASYRQHALEQGATVQELARNLKAAALTTLAKMNLTMLAADLLQGHESTISETLRDTYADLPDDDGERSEREA